MSIQPLKAPARLPITTFHFQFREWFSHYHLPNEMFCFVKCGQYRTAPYCPMLELNHYSLESYIEPAPCIDTAMKWCCHAVLELLLIVTLAAQKLQHQSTQSPNYNILYLYTTWTVVTSYLLCWWRWRWLVVLTSTWLYVESAIIYLTHLITHHGSHHLMMKLMDENYFLTPPQSCGRDSLLAWTSIYMLLIEHLMCILNAIIFNLFTPIFIALSLILWLYFWIGCVNMKS